MNNRIKLASPLFEAISKVFNEERPEAPIVPRTASYEKLLREQNRSRLFLKILRGLHKTTKADWIRSKWVRLKFFGIALDKKSLHRDRNRIYRLARKLEEQGLIYIQKNWVNDLDLNKRYQVMYFHAKSDDEMFNDLETEAENLSQKVSRLENMRRK